MKWYFECTCGRTFSRVTPCRKDLRTWECPGRDGTQPRYAGTLPEKLAAMRAHRVSTIPWSSWEVNRA